MIDRQANWNRVKLTGNGRKNAENTWDVLIIGGGATGLGAAVDAASRGYKTLLVEQADFGKGTSSRSTKLIHGGVRYLAQGNVSLVSESLEERGILCRRVPHLVQPLAFLVPSYQWWEKPYYAAGLKAYQYLAGSLSLGATEIVSRATALEKVSTLRQQDLSGGVVYYDAQFDDTRLLVTLATTADYHDAVLLNYARVDDLLIESGKVRGATIVNEETGEEATARARVVISATGAYCDRVRRMADPSASVIVAPSRGIHLVLPRKFLPGNTALMVPRTRDGRILFVIPWQDRVVVGTTDTPIDTIPLEPQASEAEIDFVLETAASYLATPPTRADVLSQFAGIRPLVKAGSGSSTSKLARDHTILTDLSGLVTITGGKWTTYRHMAEDVVTTAAKVGGLATKPCLTRDLPLWGATAEHPACDSPAQYVPSASPFAHYGADAPAIEKLIEQDPALGAPLSPSLPLTPAEVVFHARHEMARTVEDVLSRRSRSLLLDAQAALAIAPQVATLLARELAHDSAWITDQLTQFRELAQHYLPPATSSSSN